MSDDVLKIIPNNPSYVPSDAAQSEAVTALEQLLPEGEMCNAEVYEEVSFIDCGENLESVLCPECGKETLLDFFSEDDPGQTWWYRLNDLLEEMLVLKIETPMPCCGKSVPLTKMKFNWPCGFSRFELSIYNPNIHENLNESEIVKLSKILGCELSQVRAHY